MAIGDDPADTGTQCRWRGDAPAVAQVSTVQITAYDASTTYSVTINGKKVSQVGTGGSVNTTASALQSALAASTIPEFTEISFTVSTDTITMTGRTSGKPFTATSSKSGGTGTIGAVSTTTTATGPNDWNNAQNWSNGAVPIDGDNVYVENSNVSILYGLTPNISLYTLTIPKNFTGTIGLPAMTTPGTTLVTPTITSYTQADAGGSLGNSTAYYYRVSALSNFGETLASAEYTATTGSAVTGTHTLTLNWTAITGATGYRIYGRTQGAELLIATLGVVTSYTDTGSISPAGALPTSDNSAGTPYYEYRTQYLTVSTASAGQVRIGDGPGAGSGRIKIDSSTGKSVFTVIDTGRPLDTGSYAVLFKGTATTNILTVNKGSVGFATLPGETIKANTVKISCSTGNNADTVVAFGYGTSGTPNALTNITVTGGTVLFNSLVTTITQKGGIVTVTTGAVTTWTISNGGIGRYLGTSTITTLTVQANSTIDFSRDPRSRTVTTATYSPTTTVIDPGATVTYTNAISRASF